MHTEAILDYNIAVWRIITMYRLYEGPHFSLRPPAAELYNGAAVVETSLRIQMHLDSILVV